MNAYLQSLLDYIQKEKITFREEGGALPGQYLVALW